MDCAGDERSGALLVAALARRLTIGRREAGSYLSSSFGQGRFDAPMATDVVLDRWPRDLSSRHLTADEGFQELSGLVRGSAEKRQFGGHELANTTQGETG